MKFHQFVLAIATAIYQEDGNALSALLKIHGPKADELLNDLQDSRRTTLTRTAGSVIQPWGDVAVAHVQVLVQALDNNFVEAYQEQATAVQSFFRYFMTNNGWTLPLLYTFLRDLRDLAAKADEIEFATRGQKNKWLEDAARICNKGFSLCVTDRSSPKDVSRKWGTYCTIGLVFKCYFRINTTSLARNVLRAVDANPDIPPLSDFPRSDQVTYKYYLGMLNFLKEEWSQAEEDLTLAFYHCHKKSACNLNRILTYLVPLRLLRGHLPTAELFNRFPAIRQLYKPLVDAIRFGNLKAFDDTLYDSTLQKRFLDLGLYLVVEKTREICIRGLFRKVWLVLDKPTRMPVSMLHAGLKIAGQNIPVEEAECLTAVMIFKGYIRGYISHEKQMVVLAANGAFPALTQRSNPYA